MFSLGKFLSLLGTVNRVKSEKIPCFRALERAEYPMILLMMPTCAVASLPHVKWIWCKVIFLQGWMQDGSRSPEVVLFCFVLLAKFLDGTKIASEFNSCTVVYDIQLL